MAFAMMAVFSLTLVSCGDDDDEPSISFKYDQITINGKSYACYGYGMPITYRTTWDGETLSVLLPLGELSDAQKDEFDYDYMISIDCENGSKPTTGTDLANYSVSVSGVLDDYVNATYESGSAIVKSVKDDDYITIEFKNFKCKAGSESYTFNGTVKLDYDVD